MAPAELAAFDFTTLTKTRAKARTLLVDPPHDQIYVTWLQAQIDMENGEYSKYQNTMQMFNEGFNSFVAWFANTYEPANGYVFPNLEEGGEDDGDVG